MKNVIFLVLILLPTIAFADDDADIKSMLTINAGVAAGNITGSKTPCKLNILKPGEYTPVRDAFLLVLGFGDSPVDLSSYPNDGSIYEWVYNDHGTLISYDKQDKTTFTEYFFDVKTKKFQKANRVGPNNSQVCQF